MAGWYKIVEVESDEPREWSTTEGGKFHAWRVRFENERGAQLGNVELNKKPESKRPQVGTEHYGVVDVDVPHGPKFKYAKVPGGGNAVRGGSGGGGSSSNGSNNGTAAAARSSSSAEAAGDRGFGWQTNPVDAARMNRAHAQEMALRYLAIDVEAARDDNREAPDVSLKRVDSLTDRFERDVNGAPTRAAAGQEAEPDRSDDEGGGWTDGDPGPEDPGPDSEAQGVIAGDDDIPF